MILLKFLMTCLTDCSIQSHETCKIYLFRETKHLSSMIVVTNTMKDKMLQDAY